MNERTLKEDLSLFTHRFLRQVTELVVKAMLWGISLMALACLAVTLIAVHDAHITKRMESRGLVHCWGKWRTEEEKAEVEDRVGLTYEKAQERDLKAQKKSP